MSLLCLLQIEFLSTFWTTVWPHVQKICINIWKDTHTHREIYIYIVYDFLYRNEYLSILCFLFIMISLALLLHKTAMQPDFQDLSLFYARYYCLFLASFHSTTTMNASSRLFLSTNFDFFCLFVACFHRKPTKNTFKYLLKSWHHIPLDCVSSFMH